MQGSDMPQAAPFKAVSAATPHWPSVQSTRRHSPAWTSRQSSGVTQNSGRSAEGDCSQAGAPAHRKTAITNVLNLVITGPAWLEASKYCPSNRCFRRRA